MQVVLTVGSLNRRMEQLLKLHTSVPALSFSIILVAQLMPYDNFHPSIAKESTLIDGEAQESVD